MTQPIAFQVVDVQDSGTELTVRWRGAPGAHAHPVEATVVERITQQVAALAEAGRHAGRRRDIVPGRRPGVSPRPGPGAAGAGGDAVRPARRPRAGAGTPARRCAAR